ncbi:MAG: hypothetical protein M0Q47_13530 [Methanothrix sp.]|uniref:hypothetical protein n=1 Tax=Methanothrix sp. TaxID=90426 RepID=UPI0025CE99CB|nr:hypothetical protein [Methanothrix sp.]MCK9407414.1 hypothetical protein [Methanothrix sp.]
MMMGIAIFLVILVPTLFYLFPIGEDTKSSIIENPSASSPAGAEKEDPQSSSSEPVLRIASSDVSLLAVVNSSSNLSQVYLENNGITKLHRIKVTDRDRSLGTLSELDPGEKKVLSISGRAEKLSVFALDPTGLEIQGRVKYNSTKQEKNSSEDVINKETIFDPLLFSMSIPAGGAIPAEAEVPIAEEPVSPVIARNASSTSLALNISVNRSACLAGEAISYRCLATNIGQVELSDVRITCAGKLASTGFLTPHKELELDGILLVENNSRLLAEASAKDGKGNIHTNNTSIDIRMISPQIDLLLEAPELVHRGENASILIRIENSGEENLTDLKVDDGFGEVARIPALAAGEANTVQQNRTILHSLPYEVMVSARDEVGGEVYSSQSQTIAVMNSSLEIQSESTQVATYPGEPAEVTWILENTGQETLFNVTLQGNGTDCILPQMLPGRSVRMAAIYSKNNTTRINVTARGMDGLGFETTANGSVLLSAIKPGISLKVMPEKIEAAPGDEAEISCLVTNSGEDRLREVVLTLDGARLSSLGDLEPGEFRVVQARPLIEENSTLQFAVAGEDSQGEVWSDRMAVEAMTVTTAIRVFASASPSAVAPGGTSSITCTVANMGSVPLYSIFVISESLGPLGSIDILSPKHQKTITAKKSISRGGEDTITAEGFTMDRSSVRGEYNLNLVLVEGASAEGSIKPSDDYPDYNVRMAPARVSYGNSSLPFNLPEEKSTITQVSGKMARDLDQSAQKSDNAVVEGVSNLLRYVEKLLGISGGEGDDKDATNESESKEKNLSGQENYELSIEGVKSSEHGAIAILDVNAMPTQPAAEEDVKITVHIKSPSPITDASVKYGLSDAPLTRQNMKGLDRVYDTEMVLESGDEMDGYWSSTIPGRSAGTYMPLSVWMTDGSSTAEGGPYLIHWSTVNVAPDAKREESTSSTLNKKLFIESSSVKGEGEVSIKDNFNGMAMNYNENMMGSGSISMESQRSIERRQSIDNFTETTDLVFTGGSLKGHKTVESPRFDGGMGASVSERYNLSHVDRSESSSISSAGYANNSLNFKTEQAFNGTWNIQTKYAKLFKKVKADQQYKGSFQTEKDIQFKDGK